MLATSSALQCLHIFWYTTASKIYAVTASVLVPPVMSEMRWPSPEALWGMCQIHRSSSRLQTLGDWTSCYDNVNDMMCVTWTGQASEIASICTCISNRGVTNKDGRTAERTCKDGYRTGVHYIAHTCANPEYQTPWSLILTLSVSLLCSCHLAMFLFWNTHLTNIHQPMQCGKSKTQI